MSTLAAALSFTSVRKCRPGLMILTLVLTDAASLVISGAAAFLVMWCLQGQQELASYAHLLPLVFVSIGTFSAVGLYSGLSLGSPEELRRSTLASLAICAGLAMTKVFVRTDQVLFTSTTALAILFALIAIPVARYFVRLRLCKNWWWGYPAVVFGDERMGRRLIRTIREQVDLGLKPVAFVSSHATGATTMDGVPVIDEEDLPDLAPLLKGQGYALLTSATDATSHLDEIIFENRSLLPHVLVVPESWEFSCFRVTPKNVGGVLGLEIREQLSQPGKRMLKRVVDLLLTPLLIVIGVPLFAAIALAIKLDSSGPIMYGHRRIGRGGREFKAWKFRSMVVDADEQLTRYLEQHPELCSEWNQNHKLRYDPRITRIGRVLRKTSLDEIPQLWNVLRGEMSLVGPRPIVRAEIPKYGKYFDLYTQVSSGLTGLWQVSGRSDTSYEQRVIFDAFYVRNWSVWLDLFILFRTISILCFRTGAY